MPKNKGKGGKNKRRGRNDNEDDKRELQLKSDDQVYGQVIRMVGNNRLDCNCYDGVKRLCHIRGKMRKRVWVNAGDIVLVSLRTFEEGRGDVVAKYAPDEARALKACGELPDNAQINEYDGHDEDADHGIEFKESSGESDSSDNQSDRQIDVDDI